MLYLCYSINDFFAREAGISMIGFFENNPDYEPEEVFFLDYGIHPYNKQRLNEIADRYGKRVTFLNAKAVTDVVKREFPDLKGWRGSMAPNAKCFVEQIFPDYVERLLFIDADTIVAGSVAELKTIDMNGSALGVVPVNLGVDEIRKGKLKLANGNQIYFNSGVLLFNLPVWRRENCHQMIIDMLNKKIDLDWPDQNLLNNAIPERLIKTLPLKYNYLSHYYHPRQERGWLRIGHYYSEEEIEEAISHPAIIHYLGGGWILARPWYRDCRSSKSGYYLHYKALSPWKDSPLTKSNEDTHPPQGFSQKADYWLMKLQGECPYFHLVRMIDTVYSFIMLKIDKILKKKKIGK